MMEGTRPRRALPHEMQMNCLRVRCPNCGNEDLEGGTFCFYQHYDCRKQFYGHDASGHPFFCDVEPLEPLMEGGHVDVHCHECDHEWTDKRLY